jgi:lysozyme
LQLGERLGIDVSSHQGAIDWARASADGINFAYIKATEGGDWVDDRFASNWAGAADAGLQRGAYHFFTLCRPGADQADNFLRTVPLDPTALPPVVDLEFSGNCSGRPDAETLRQELGTFVNRVEAATARQVVFYVMDDFDRRYRVTEVFDRERWRRRLFHRPAADDWVIWQSSDRARVAGIEGGVDLNVMKQNMTSKWRRHPTPGRWSSVFS